MPALLAALLTLLRYDAKPLWRDEVYTLSTAGRSVAQMMGLLSERDGGLVGYYALMHPWLAVSEDSWWIRLPSAVATVALVALVAVVGRRVAGAPRGWWRVCSPRCRRRCTCTPRRRGPTRWR